MYFSIATTYVIKEGSGSGDISLGTQTEVHQAYSGPPTTFRFLLRTKSWEERWALEKSCSVRELACLGKLVALQTTQAKDLYFLFWLQRICPTVLEDRHLLPRTEGCPGSMALLQNIFPSSQLWMFPSRSFVEKQLLAREWLFTAPQLAIYFNHYLILKTL